MPLSSLIHNDPMRSSVRFPLRLNVLLRAGDREYAATTEDVSANGTLFRGAELPPAGSVVQFRLTLPADLMGGEEVVLMCEGRIVRHKTEDDGAATAAAVIDTYSLRAGQNDER